MKIDNKTLAKALVQFKTPKLVAPIKKGAC